MKPLNNNFIELISGVFQHLGITQTLSGALSILVLLVLTLALAWLSGYIARQYLAEAAEIILARFNKELANLIRQNKVIVRLSRIAPAGLVYLLSQLFIMPNHAISMSLVLATRKLSLIYIWINISIVILAILRTLEQMYNTLEVSRKRPIKSYLQVIQAFVFVSIFVFVVSEVLDVSPWGFFTGLGAAAALLLIVFKDVIMGFLASIQLASFDMIRLGDWISVPSFGADGDVEEISLSTVKVRNFDKTIVTIPTYGLLTHGVQNWRGMQESGGRRIKRSIRIDMQSIRFCDTKLLDKLNQSEDLKEYLGLNQSKVQDGTSPGQNLQALNQANLTNIGLYRIYIEKYLARLPQINGPKSPFTFLVRQLTPTELGLPIEIYVFTTTTNWIAYERIQSDIFDHLLASLKSFDLRAYQRSSDAS